MNARALLSAAPLILLACSPAAESVASAEPTPDPALEGQALFVAGKFGNTLARVDLATGEETARVDSCTNPHELATSPDNQYVALACYGGQTIDIFRTADLGKVASIDLGDNARPHGIIWHADGNIYATAEGKQEVARIRRPLSDRYEITFFRTDKRGSHMLAVAPDARHAWTTDLGSKTVTLIDMQGDAAPRSVEVGEEPEGIWLAPDGATLWVSARGSNKAFALDPMTLEVRREIATGAFPLRIALRPQGDFAVTSDLADGGLTVIDTASGEAVRSIAVSSPAEARDRTQVTILFSPHGERIYVAETGTDTVAEVDFASGEVLRRFSAGDGGDGMAIVE